MRFALSPSLLIRDNKIIGSAAQRWQGDPHDLGQVLF